jgi:hypothetical protein
MKPVDFLKVAGIEVVEMDGLIEQGLDYVYNGTPFPGRRIVKEGCSCGQGSGAPSLFDPLLGSNKSACGKSCSASGDCGGNGLGCM